MRESLIDCIDLRAATKCFLDLSFDLTGRDLRLELDEVDDPFDAFLDEYHSQLRPFAEKHEVAPGCSLHALVATPPGTAWSAWHPAATG